MIPLNPENDTFDCRIQRLNKHITVPLKSETLIVCLRFNKLAILKL